MRPLTLLLTLALFVTPLSVGAQQRSGRPLFKDSRAELALARVRGDSTALLVIAARSRHAADVAREIERAGGVVAVRDTEVDYVRARVPVDAVQRIASSALVEAVDVSVPGSWGRVVLQTAGSETPLAPLPAAAVDTPPAWPPVRSEYPLSHPFSPLDDIAARTFLTQHPTFDGRGVTIAVLDGNVDLLLPEFQTAYALDGTRVPKLAGFRNTMDPREERQSANAQWIEMATRVNAAGGVFEHEGKRWTAPRDGEYRFGFFDESGFDSPYLGDDLNRDGNPEGSSRQFGVLWDSHTNTVRVDTDQDRDFTDEKELHDFHVRRDTGVFGRDDPATPVRESIGFAVQTAPAVGFVAINVGYYQHGTMVAGAAVANTDGGGRVRGVAPGARLVSIYWGSSAYGMAEGLIDAFRDPLIDIIVLEQNVYVADIPYYLHDGRSVVGILTDRLIERTGKPLFVPAGNSPGLQQTGEHGVGRGIAVGAYQSQENYLVNSGIVPAPVDNLHYVGSHGPAGNGAMLPEIVSPTAVVTTYPAFRYDDAPGHPYRLPPGYSICGGTSCATPVAAAAAALLLSGARQSAIEVSADDLTGALAASARHLPGIETIRQGVGLIQVGPAWDALSAGGNAGAVAVEVRAPVRTALGGWLREPGMGVGLLEREDWLPGDSAERRIVLRRTGGVASPARFALGLIGDDSTFSVPAEVTLPRGRDVEVPVRIAPRSAGVKSALLTIAQANGRARATAGMTVVAAESFHAEDGWVIKREITVPRPGRESMFLRVPEEAAALRVGLETSHPTRLMLIRPDGVEDTGGGMPEAKQNRVVRRPMPGVWEVLVFDMQDAFTFTWDLPMPLPETRATITASLLGTAVESAPVSLGALEPGTTTTGRASFRNLFASFDGGARAQPLATAAETRVTIAQGEQRTFEIDVPEGSTRLLASVRDVADADSDLDVYVFDCTGERCLARRSAAGPGAVEEVRVESPAAGTWRVVVDAARVPAGSTTFTWLDAVLNPRYGGITIADPPRKRAPGTSWDAQFSVWLAEAPPPGRVPFGQLLVTDPELEVRFRVPTADFSLLTRSEPVALGIAELRFGRTRSAEGAR